jgi:thiol-disulfide isomerase/thioredoxin
MSCLEVTNDSALKKFNSNIDNGVWLVWFYAGWCGHCKQMIQPWNTFADVNRSGVNLAKVSEDYVHRIKSNPNIQGWPTIMLYKNGQPVDTYQGDRTPEGFNEYVNNNRDSTNSGADMSNDLDRNVVDSNHVIKLLKPKRNKSVSRKSKKGVNRNSNSNGTKVKSGRKKKGSRKGVNSNSNSNGTKVKSGRKKKGSRKGVNSNSNSNGSKVKSVRRKKSGNKKQK